MNGIQFEVGQLYENTKGAYEVLVIEGDDMRIRWETGEEVATTMKMQRRIIERMQRERERPPIQSRALPAKRKTKTPTINGKKYEGLKSSHFFK
ncbi:MAG: hypothetical protein HQ553_09190 [Chloroflexi bacterium]|nr:hypothetical protein [Chloroflexota bacterium]